MRRYYVASGILFILPIIDFALAAPVLVQENRQPCVNVVHIPKDMMTVLGKRGGEDLLEEFYKWMEKPVKSSDTHGASGSAPPGPNPVSSTANPYPLMVEPSGPSSTAPIQGLSEDHLLTDYDLYDGWMGAHAPQPNSNKRPLTDPEGEYPWEELYRWMEKLVQSSDTHAASSSASPGPNPVLSTTNPHPLMVESSGLSSTAPMQGSWEDRF